MALFHSALWLSSISLLEKAMATHSSTHAWKIPWTEEPGRLQTMGSPRVGHFYLHFHFSRSCIGEGNGNQLQCSCLEHPRDGGAWWAAVYAVAQSRTRLKRLSSSSSNVIERGSHFFGANISAWEENLGIIQLVTSLIGSYKSMWTCDSLI